MAVYQYKALDAEGQVAGVVGRLFWGAVSGNIFSATVVLVIIGILSAICIVLLAGAQPGASKFALVGVCIAVGFSSFGWNGVFIAEVTSSVSSNKVGDAVGGTQFFFFGGVVIFPALIGLLAQQAGFRMAFGALVLIALFATTCIAIAGRRPA